MRLARDQVLEDLDGIQEHIDNAELDERAAAGGRLDGSEEGFAQGLTRAEYVEAARELLAKLPEDVRELASAVLDEVEDGGDLRRASADVEQLIRRVRTGALGAPRTE